MKKAFLLFASCFFVSQCGPKGDAFLNKTIIIMADSTLAAKIVSTEDEYTKNLGAYDLSLAADSGTDASLKDFLHHLAKNVREWTDEEKEKFKSVVKKAEPKLNSLNLKLPEEITVIKTSSYEYGGIKSGYTRQNAIMITENLFNPNDESLYDVFLHEIFHIYTRTNPEKKEAFYNIIGFYQGNDVSLPEDWYNRRITIPDAPAINTYIDLSINGDTATFIPLFFARETPYNPFKAGGIFQSAQYGLMKVEKKQGVYAPVFEKGRPVVINPGRIKEYWKKIGRNSNYIIHPEEIIASNFVFLINKKKRLPNPEVVRGIRKVLSE